MQNEALHECINIKGTKHGLLIYCNGQVAEGSLTATLEKRLQEANGFFSGAMYSLHCIPPTNEDTTKQLHTLCKHYGLVLADTPIEPPKPVKKHKMRRKPAPIKAKPTTGPMGDTLLLHKNIRSGGKVTHDGNVVLLGDLNPGAEIKATGNILVLGALRGTAHAGCAGDMDAVIAAYKLHPSQLRIADKIARSPESLIERPFPELAFASEEEGIIIEKYNPNKRR
ncbi:septum site-determining protein MinC [Metallumcola ferriviriculae]|uniref:Probable septum site-determining protein MinC n=1 Tax=Metallumcola ferriviriculae TaxID=3039180 RepID=A0AAU0USK3_9FIRM|nr:septum site-determining protein MinC [Desulfitibacteraceae bacterium MK1]